MKKLKAAGCPVKFSSLEDSVRDYVVNYLQKPDQHLRLRKKSHFSSLRRLAGVIFLQNIRLFSL